MEPPSFGEPCSRPGPLPHPAAETPRVLIQNMLVYLIHFRMQDLTSRVPAGISDSPPSEDKSSRLGILTSWNVKCGIAEYSRYLRDALETAGTNTEIFSNFTANLLGEDDIRVFRCWDNTAGTLRRLSRVVQERKINRFLIQYHYGFYPPKVLASLICQLEAMNVSVFVIHHVTNYKRTFGN